MTRCQSRWVNVIIIALVIILRFPTLWDDSDMPPNASRIAMILA